MGHWDTAAARVILETLSSSSLPVLLCELRVLCASALGVPLYSYSFAPSRLCVEVYF
jgi:hypothetical protein